MTNLKTLLKPTVGVCCARLRMLTGRTFDAQLSKEDAGVTR